MAVNKTKKSEILDLLEQELKKANSVAFTTNSKLTVEDISSIRKDLRKVDSKLILAKKTLIKLAFQKVYNIELSDDVLIGQIAVLISCGDNLAPLSAINKYVNEFKKDEKIKFAGAYFDKNIISSVEVTRLASLPSKEALLAKLLGSMKSPISALARFLDAAEKELKQKTLTNLKDLISSESKKEVEIKVEKVEKKEEEAKVEVVVEEVKVEAKEEEPKIEQIKNEEVKPEEKVEEIKAEIVAEEIKEELVVESPKKEVNDKESVEVKAEKPKKEAKTTKTTKDKK